MKTGLVILLATIAAFLSCSKPAPTANDAKVQELEEEVQRLKQQQSTAPSPTPRAAPLRKAVPDFTLAAGDFHEECQRNGAAFELKYKGKTVRLSGWTGTINPSEVLVPVTRNTMYYEITFRFDPADTGPLPTLIPRAPVSITGVFDGGTDIWRLTLSHCVVDRFQ